MGFLVILVSYLFVAVAMFILGPFLFWFAAKKFGKFENNTLKKHALFWFAWFTVNLLLGFALSLFQEQAPTIHNFLNSSLMLTLVIHIGLCMAIFSVNFIPALKATLAYIAVFVMTFFVVAVIAVQFSFHELFLGAGQ